MPTEPKRSPFDADASRAVKTKMKGTPYMTVPASMTRQFHFMALTVLVSFATVGCGDDTPPTTQANGNQNIADVSVNEVQTKNSSFLSDTGKKSDWLEFYNGGNENVSLDGYYISDAKSALLKARLPAEAVVPARGFLVIWLDDTTDPNTPLHFPFKLSGDGENFYLSTAEGTVVQKVTIPADPNGTNTTVPDVSYGAFPDGSSTMGWCRNPTPGEPNAEDCKPGPDAGT